MLSEQNNTANPSQDLARSKAMGLDYLEALALQLAQDQPQISRQPDRRPSLIDQVDEIRKQLDIAYERFANSTAEKLATSLAGEWLLDNMYIVRRALRLIREDLPKGFYRQLPKLLSGSLQGYPRVYRLAHALVNAPDIQLGSETIQRFVAAYQNVTPLTTGELWALPLMLRLTALEELASTALHITALDTTQVQEPRQEHPEQKDVDGDTIVANAILNLRFMATQNWKEIVENLSCVEQALRQDPAGVYAHMDFETRDRYRGVIEKIALATGREEEEVALEAIALAKKQHETNTIMAGIQESDPNRGDGKSLSSQAINMTSKTSQPEATRLAHVGFYLLDIGRKQLEDRLGLQRSGWVRFRAWSAAHPNLYYMGSISVLTAALLLAVLSLIIPIDANPLVKSLLGLLSIVPALTVSVNLINWFITLITPVQSLPKVDFQEGIPESFRTMVVIPSMLSSSENLDSLIEQLEFHFLSNTDHNLYFALLTDFTDAPQKVMPEDQILLEQAKAGIRNLNDRYASREQGRFSLFHRERIWNPSEKRWMGWERKRGKLTEFNHLLRGDQNTSYNEICCAPKNLDQIRYVITLDGDTILPEGNARRLVGTLAHPLNQALFDPNSGTVLSGYTILQPRVEIKPTSANQNIFSRIFSEDIALDLYSRAVSDVYQDFFGEGIYVGKGIYEVDTFERSLKNRVPENALLSHDLFEGIHGRAALVTDIMLLEDFPPHYLAFAQRLHRWQRGDWQILPWLFPRVPGTGGKKLPNRLSPLSRWKIFDNLRRSLLMPTSLALLLASWTFLPSSSWVWSVVIPLILAIPLLTSVINDFVRLIWRKLHGLPISFRHSSDFWRWILALLFLPIEAFLSTHAIASTLFRLLITHRGMLQWTTSAESVRRLGKLVKPDYTVRQILAAFSFTTAAGVWIGFVNPNALPSAIPFILLWLISPQIARWISLPRRRETIPLSPEDHDELRRIARRTWLFFEEFVGPEDHWLPPDHFQEDPLGFVAHRTSPTNIGLLMLSTLAAYDLGYISSNSLAFRLNTTLDTLQNLERHRGHFLNWYDTRSLQPLSPRYVSTVDSGNLAASLLVLREACSELPQDPVLRWERWQAMLDALSFFTDVLENLDLKDPVQNRQPILDTITEFQQQILDVRYKPDRWVQIWAQLRKSGWKKLSQAMKTLLENEGKYLETSNLTDLRTCNDLVHVHLFRVHREIDTFLPWLSSLARPPALFSRKDLDPSLKNAWDELYTVLQPSPALKDIPALCQVGKQRLDELKIYLDQNETPYEELEVAREWCLWLSKALEDASLEAGTTVQNFSDLEQKVEREFQGMDFKFLFDTQRQVFYIGYHVDTGRLDDNYYDLLASEARLASIIAMAKRDVPQSHWLHLGRPLTHAGDMRVLLSWSGTMFEYLMPTLLVQEYEDTLLSQSNCAAVDQQINYGLQNNVPWGISESGYYTFDANMFYQYRAFGIPSLGFKRGLAEDLVITPYASILALSFRPKEVLKNIHLLNEMGMKGRYGFYEAADFTAARLPLGDRSAIVRSYMAHHQGMILLAISNWLSNHKMVQRFQSDPRIKGVELLLQERVPHDAPVEETEWAEISAVRPDKPKVTITPWSVPFLDFSPRVHFLSNGRYSLMLTSSGGGFSRWQNIDLTRWRADRTLENWGTWIYIQDRETQSLWSLGYQPTGVQARNQNVSFDAHKAEFWREDGDISSRMEITVAPDDDVEIRRISLMNQGFTTRQLMLTSYAEVILSDQASDRHHPAFNKMFIQSEFLAEHNALLFRRRIRSPEDQPQYLAHILVREPGKELSKLYEADRAAFIGRGRTVRNPLAISPSGSGLSGTVGATLDPIMALGQEIDIAPGRTEQLAWITLAAPSRDEALALIQRYRDWPTLNYTFDRARSQVDLELWQLGYSSSELENINLLLGALFFPDPSHRAAPTKLAANRKGQAGLWPFTISGDYPILLLEVSSQEETAILLELLRAHVYWRKRQLKIDLVILNEHETGYAQDLSNHLFRMVSRMDGEAWLNRRGGIFLLRSDQMEKDDGILLESAARVILTGDGGSLSEQLARRSPSHARLPSLVPSLPSTPGPISDQPVARPKNLLFDNGLGGFSPDGREYIIYLQPEEKTPAPWVNVIAHSSFGFLVSEAGVSSTWAENSGENRLTPWNNDPVSDTPGEALYLRDEETGEIWSPTPLPAGASAPYLVRHGAGYSIFEHHSHSLHQQLKLFAAPDDPLKIIQLTLKNTTDRNRHITATYYAEWVLGTDRDQSQMFIIPEFDHQTQALLAYNPYNAEFPERMAFLAGSKQVHGLTGDRTEFLGRMSTYDRPSSLNLIGLTGTVQAGLDPCAAIMLHVDLPPGGSQEIYFLLGQGKNRQSTRRLIERYQKPEEVHKAWEAVEMLWDGYLDAVQVKTPDLAMDLLLNRWLMYQSLSCRFWGRTAFYQSSGAYGFRDQLQDVMAFIHTAPELAREHLLEAAQHQFEEGDVLHWWHPPSDRGVRTRISDDLLWLPFVTAYYVLTTGDTAILNEKIPFLHADALGPEEHERYGLFPAADQVFSLYEHCIRAIQRGSTRGPHGLPLIGSGDWNDGMNRVGIQGRGESVWLGWFLCRTLLDFMPICEQMGDGEHAQSFRQQAENLRSALEGGAWDGAWYRRAYYDDGTPMGSFESLENQIDSIAQSWAVLSHAADPARSRMAMDSLVERLVQREDQIMPLFTPAFDKGSHDPGYIKGYLPGIRENGGQYTHGVQWAVWALAELGRIDEAEELFRLLNPIYHGQNPEKYYVEPYVIAADVYSIPPHAGRGGWTWYTGSSAWFYRLGLEGLLGLQRRGNSLVITPRIPKHWSGFEITYRWGNSVYHIHVDNSAGVNQGVGEISLDKNALKDSLIPLIDDGQEHEVRIMMGA